MEGKTYYASRKVIDLSSIDIPNFGPHGNVRGMRKLYYGDKCDLVKQGAYCYKINQLHGHGEIYARLEQAGIA
jgi:hypothetical protein